MAAEKAAASAALGLSLTPTLDILAIPFSSSRSRSGALAMIARVLLGATLFHICSSAEALQTSPVHTTQAADETNADVVMDAAGRLFIYYDDRPDVAVGSFPGDHGYPLYLELTGDLQPGQRGRLAKAVAMYARNADGSYSIFEMLRGAGQVSEAGVRRVAGGSSEHQCYRQILGATRGPGQHYLLLSQRRAIDRCMEASDPTGPSH